MTIHNYLFLGLPLSGKTTYFSIMAKHLQDTANQLGAKNVEVKFLPTIVKYSSEDGNGNVIEEEQEFTSDFIRECNKRIKNREWPVQTQEYSRAYSLELTVHPKSILKWFYKKVAIIDNHDYPGESFEIAFAPHDNKEKLKDLSENNDFVKYAKDLKERVKSAKGIFLILDSEKLISNAKPELDNSITSLIRYIGRYNKKVKLAIVFTKLEKFYGNEPDCESLLRDGYGNAYAHLLSMKNKCRFFNVYPVGALDTDSNGKTIPPQILKTKNVLEPIKWMLNIEDISFES